MKFPIYLLVSTAITACVLAIAAMHAETATADTQILNRTIYSSELDGLSVAFLARDLENGTEHVLEGSDLDARHAPWSTFKIPNLVIALELGVAAGLEERRDWDPIRRPAAAYWPDGWREGQSLGEAFKRSSVWYFQDLALDIGGARYRALLSRWAYGNASVADETDDFWLGGSLEISVREQVNFLGSLLSGELKVSAATLNALDTASLTGVAPGVTLHGKTGSGPDEPGNFDGAFSGWYAGYLRRDNLAPIVFALHVSARSFSDLRDFRQAFTIRLLEDAGLVPENALRSQ